METNDTESPDLAEFEVFDYRDVVNVISYTLMISGLFLFVDLCLIVQLVEIKTNKQVFKREFFQLASFSTHWPWLSLGSSHLARIIVHISLDFLIFSNY